MADDRLSAARHAASVLRRSHEALTAEVGDLTPEQLAAPAYPTEWSIAQVLSHLGSGAEIFGIILAAGAAGASEAPGRETYQPVWERWDARSAQEQRDGYVVATEQLLDAIDGLNDVTAQAWGLHLYGSHADLGTFVAYRVSEHALHSWDVLVALDPSAQVAPEAVALIVPGLPVTAGWSGKPTELPGWSVVLSTTTEPRVVAAATVGTEVRLQLLPHGAEPDAPVDGLVELPAEALVRLVYGRLDPDHTPAGITQSGGRGLTDLRLVFPGL